MIGTLILLIPFPLLFASMLNSKLMKGQGFFKSVYFLPALTSVVVAGTIFRLMFGEMDTSLANQIMELLGKSPIKWLKGEWTGYFALLIVACWEMDRCKYFVFPGRTAEYSNGYLRGSFY